ncbi:hypothetical protein H1C71_041129, partial [Ictidomys tridecemlineatus]
SEKITPLKTVLRKSRIRRDWELKEVLRPMLNTLLESGSVHGDFRSRDESGDESSFHEPMEMKPLEINPSCPAEENDVSVLIPVGDQLPEARLSTDVPGKKGSNPNHSFPPETTGIFQDNRFGHLDISDKLSTDLFQDKSEEASLNLVFELVSQLQCHTHKENGIEICMEFLHGTCI